MRKTTIFWYCMLALVLALLAIISFMMIGNVENSFIPFIIWIVSTILFGAILFKIELGIKRRTE